MLKVKQGDVEKFDIEAYQYNAEIMGEVNLSCEVYLDVPLTYFSLDMYVNINGENLYLSSFEPTGVKNTDNIYPKYSLVFESKRVQLKRKYFRDLTSDLAGIEWGTEYSFYGNIADFATRFQKNLTKYFLNNEWSIEVYGNHSQDVSVLFEASNLYLFDALKQMSETWDKEWRIVSSGATNVIQVGFPQETLTHNFEYEGGNGGGGLTVIQKEVDTSNIITRMLSAGSTKNIPYQYFRELSASELEAGNVQDPNVAPIFSNGYYNLMPACFRRYITGWNEGNNGTTYSPPRPTYTPEFWKGYDDGRKTFFGNLTYNPITYYESESIEVWGEREGIVEVNEDIFPTISGIDTRDEVVDVEQILSNEQSADTSITRHHLDYDAIGDKFGQTLEIGEITITNANQEEFNYYGIINVLSGYSGTNSATISIKYQLENLSWQEEYSKTFSYNASSSDKRIYDNVKLTRNTTYKIYIIINGHTESIFISQFNSGYRFYQSLKSKYNQSNIINGYFQNSGNTFNPIILNTDYANSYTIHAITNEVSYIYGTFRTDIRMCSCDFKLVLQVDYGNGNFIDAPAYIDDEGIVYESYRLYTKTPNDLSSNTTYNFEDNYTFYLDGNYSYRLVTRIISFTPAYKYNGNLLRTFYNQKSFIYNTTHSSSISLLHNIHAEAYLAWGQGYYNIEFTVAKALIDNAITLGIFLAAELTTLIDGFESYLVEFNMDNLFTQKIGRPYKGYFSVWIKDIGFNINDYKSSQPAQLNFTTGALAGEDYLFEILDVTPDTSRTSSAYRLKCLKSDADKDATGLAIPNTFKQGQAGDKFILLNINMPYNPYVLNAEERLETYVKAELDKVCDAKRAFSIEVYDPFISSFAETNKLITGNYIKIKHTNLIGSGSTATVQIKGITITQSKGDMFPKFAIILSEESSITRPTITRRGGGIIGDLYRRYRDLGDSLGNVTRNVSSINTNLGRTINVDTFNNNYRQVSGVNKEINALALSAKTTADEKNKCWAVKPIPPYYVGDQWLVNVATGDFIVNDTVYCKTTRLTGVFTNSDWGLSRYKGLDEIDNSLFLKIGTLPLDKFGNERNVSNILGQAPINKQIFGSSKSLESDVNLNRDKIVLSAKKINTKNKKLNTLLDFRDNSVLGFFSYDIEKTVNVEPNIIISDNILYLESQIFMFEYSQKHYYNVEAQAIELEPDEVNYIYVEGQEFGKDATLYASTELMPYELKESKYFLVGYVNPTIDEEQTIEYVYIGDKKLSIGIDERMAMLESKIAYLLGAVAKPMVSSDNYRFITSDNKILKVL